MAGPHADIAAARRAVRSALQDLPPGERVLVACSGGPDSCALAATTAFVAAREGWLAGAVIVDHRLRPDSSRTAAKTAVQCYELGLDPVEIRRVSVPGGSAGTGAGGPEAAARQERYRALEAAAVEYGEATVLLGHTMDDQAETVLLGLARGSGARSLAGMPAVRGRWRRPFLGLRRRQTVRICYELGLEPDWDETNHVDGPWRAADGTPLRRAAVRDRVLPALRDALGPGVVGALSRTAEQLARDADLLEAQAGELLSRALVHPAAAEAAVPTDPRRPTAEREDLVAARNQIFTLGEARGAGDGQRSTIVLDVAVLDAAHPALRSRALRSAALQAGASPGALAAVHVETLDALVTSYHGQGPIPLPGGVQARRTYGRLTFGPP